MRLVDIRPVSQRFRHEGQVLAFGRLVEERSRMKVPHVFRVGRVGLCLQLRLAAGVLGDLAL